MVSIAVAAIESSQHPRAEQLAAQLGVSMTIPHDTHFDLLLLVSAEHLALQQNTQPPTKPLVIDFLAGKNAWRQKVGGRELLVKAVGIKGTYKPSVIDATAGLGRDAFVLANSGCHVTMLERSPIMGILLQDGLERFQAVQPLENLQLVQQDALRYLANSEMVKPDVIYLDPMYPHRTKTALVKKEMRILRALVGGDQDAAKLCQVALQVAQKRVVVKRPRIAEPLIAKPDIVFAGSSSRFDVYLTKGQNDAK